MDLNYALLIKINRLCQGISSASLAEVTGVEKTQLHRLEKGHQQIDINGLDQLLKGLNLDRDIINKCYNDYQSKIYTIQRRIIYADKIEVIESELKNINLEMKSNFLTCDLLLVNYMFNISLCRNYGVVEAIDKILLKCINIMTDVQLGKFYLYKGIYLNDKQHYSKALESLKMAANFSHESSNLLGQIYRVSAFVYCKINKIREAILYNEKAKNELVKECNFFRLIQTINQDGIISFYLKQYEQAKEYFEKSLNEMKSLDYPVEDYAFCYINIHLCMIMTREYEDARYYYDQLDDEIKEILLKDSTFIMHQAIKYFLLGMKKECLLFIQKYKNTFSQIEIEKIIIKYLNQRIKLKESQDKRSVIKTLNQAVSICKKNQNFSNWDLIIHLVSYEYEKNKENLNDFDILFENIMSR